MIKSDIYATLPHFKLLLIEELLLFDETFCILFEEKCN